MMKKSKLDTILDIRKKEIENLNSGKIVESEKIILTLTGQEAIDFRTIVATMPNDAKHKLIVQSLMKGLLLNFRVVTNIVLKGK